MKSSLDLYTEHVWLFLHSYEKFNYADITFLPPNTILIFRDGKDIGYGRISLHKPIKPYDYCLKDVIWNSLQEIPKSGGAIDPFCINSGDIIYVCGDLSLKWKKISDALKEGEKEMKETLKSIYDLMVHYEDILRRNLVMESLESRIDIFLSKMKEDLYIRLILSHRKDKPRSYP